MELGLCMKLVSVNTFLVWGIRNCLFDDDGGTRKTAGS